MRARLRLRVRVRARVSSVSSRPTWANEGRSCTLWSSGIRWTPTGSPGSWARARLGIGSEIGARVRAGGGLGVELGARVRVASARHTVLAAPEHPDGVGGPRADERGGEADMRERVVRLRVVRRAAMIDGQLQVHAPLQRPNLRLGDRVEVVGPPLRAEWALEEVERVARRRGTIEDRDAHDLLVLLLRLAVARCVSGHGRPPTRRASDGRVNLTGPADLPGRFRPLELSLGRPRTPASRSSPRLPRPSQPWPLSTRPGISRPSPAPCATRSSRMAS